MKKGGEEGVSMCGAPRNKQRGCAAGVAHILDIFSTELNQSIQEEKKHLTKMVHLPPAVFHECNPWLQCD
jgi:hypothetical protein